MSTIILYPEIKAPAERCYDLSLSVDLHKISTGKTGEHIVDGVKEGIMKLSETITWRAKHFGVWQKLTTQITKTERPFLFEDVMLKGAFKSMRHEHHFKEENGKTTMKDVFDFESPLWILGKIANVLFLESYMTKFLKERNAVIKEFAESDKWKQVLKT